MGTDLDGILLLVQQQRVAEKTSTSKKNQPDTDQAISRAIEIQRRGAVHVLKAVAAYFGENLPLKVSYLWEMIMSIQTIDDRSGDQETR